MQPPPPKDSLPTVLLLQSNYFEKLFRLMQTLGDMKPQMSNIHLYTKAQLLSRRVWDILAILPTNPMILEVFKGLSTDLIECEKLASEEEQINKRKEIKAKLNELLDATNLQKFMYSLHIVESLALNSVFQGRGIAPCCGGANGNVTPLESYGSGRIASKTSNNNSNSNTNRNCHVNTNKNRSTNSNNESVNTTNIKDDLKKSSSSSSPLNINSNNNNINMDDGENNNEINWYTDCSTLHPAKSNVSETECDDIDECGNDKENNPTKTNRTHNKIKNELTSAISSSSSAVQMHNHTNHSNGSNSYHNDEQWSDVFIRCGGLKHLYDLSLIHI